MPLISVAIVLSTVMGVVIITNTKEKVSKEYSNGIGGKYGIPMSYGEDGLPLSYTALTEKEREKKIKQNLKSATEKREKLIKEGKFKEEKRKDLDELIGGDWYYYENTTYEEMRAYNADGLKSDEQYRKFGDSSIRPEFYEGYVDWKGDLDPTPVAYWYEDKANGWIIGFTAYTPVYTLDDKSLESKLVKHNVEIMRNELKEYSYNVALVKVENVRTDFGYEGKRFIHLDFINKEIFKTEGWGQFRHSGYILIGTKEENYFLTTDSIYEF